MCTSIEAKELSSKIPLAEVITCSGFFLISFLEELIHHFIHPSDNHKKNKKSKIHRQSGKVADISQRNEFELYDEKSKKERKKETATISSIEDPHFTDPEEGTWVCLFACLFYLPCPKALFTRLIQELKYL